MLSTYKEITLNVEKVAQMASIDLDVIDNCMGIDSMLEYETSAMLLRLNAFVACSDEKTFYELYPKTAWEHIKEDYAPKWFKRKFPIKYAHITFKAKEAFPEYSVLNNVDGKVKRHLHIRIPEFNGKCSYHA